MIKIIQYIQLFFIAVAAGLCGAIITYAIARLVTAAFFRSKEIYRRNIIKRAKEEKHG